MYVTPSDLPSVDACIQMLHDKDSLVRSKGARLLSYHRTNALPALKDLLQYLDDESVMTRLWVTNALGAIGPVAKEAVSALSEALKDDILCINAAFALAEIRDAPEAVPYLHDALKNAPNDEFKGAAARALWRITRDEKLALPSLIEVMQGTELWAKVHGAETLAELGSEGGIDSLIQATGDPYGEVRRSAVEALGAIGPKASRAVDAIKQGAEVCEDDHYLLIMSLALWKITGDAAPAIPVLTSMVSPGGPFTTCYSEEGAERISKGDRPLEVRLQAIDGLGAIGPRARTALPYLSPIENDPQVELSLAAKKSLRLINQDE